ncbi:alpha-L-fucosidase [Stieleria sp.]|uniref:alpha-L-fucosidase n=1 Tax=Stieleria sp. TaxID=2795976 RepID=UPI0035630093
MAVGQSDVGALALGIERLDASEIAVMRTRNSLRPDAIKSHRNEGQIMKIKSFTLLACLCAMTLLGIASAQTPTAEDHMKWWRDARFGMFIHWGLYPQPSRKTKRKEGKGVLKESKTRKWMTGK